MDLETKKALRDMVLQDITQVAACMDHAQGIIHDTGWGTSRKHAENVAARMLDMRQDIVNLLFELRDCLRDDEEAM